MMYESVINLDKCELVEDDESVIRDEPDCAEMIYGYMHLNGVNDDILDDLDIRIDSHTDNIDSSILKRLVDVF